MLLWTAVAILTAVGILAAVMRMAIVLQTSRVELSQRPALDAADRRLIELALSMRGDSPSSPAGQEATMFLARSAGRFANSPRITALHMIPGILMSLLMPLQFVRRIRERHVRIHRWSGRLILAIGLGVAVSALYFGVVNPLVPRIEWPVIGLFLVLFVLSLTRGWLAIRRGDRATHREWMIRAYAVVLGIATVRLMSFPLLAVTTITDPGVMLITTFWTGWLLTVGAAEVWIRTTRLSSG